MPQRGLIAEGPAMAMRNIARQSDEVGVNLNSSLRDQARARSVPREACAKRGDI